MQEEMVTLSRRAFLTSSVALVVAIAAPAEWANAAFAEGETAAAAGLRCLPWWQWM